MKISTKGRYALRMLIELGCHAGDSYVSLKEISESQNISKKYLEQIVPLLTKSGILRTTRGNHGGYMLAKPASEITVADVLRATEGSLAPVSCLEQPVNDCPRADICPTLELWKGLMRTVEDYLERYSVQDLVDRKLNLGGDDYSI
ncbi:MAG TPA: Rrf2 family transcriptional regulator [Ruminococcus sp.]|nr:Rrf2 family transcriptional regulator [Ruminococcus sp.]